MQLRPNHQQVLDRFTAACKADSRVAAAFLCGSYARGTADALSDLDLFVVVADSDYDSFTAGREAFVRQLGEPLFLEDFDLPGTLFYILSDDTEGELNIGRMSQVDTLIDGPIRIRVDKNGILSGVAASRPKAGSPPDAEALRRQIHLFWHELSHFITGMGRGHLWWAYGQLEALRRNCVNLIRLNANPADPEVGEECYWKIDKTLPPERLEALRSSISPLEREAMLDAAAALIDLYREQAQSLAQTRGLTYPARLDDLFSQRFAALKNRQPKVD